MERFAWRLFLAAILWCFSASSHRIERNSDRVSELNRTIDALVELRTKLEDVDECKINQHTCHVNATCANTIGGYNCTCNLPYAGDGRACDVNECKTNQHRCHVNATCVNALGGYYCGCNLPYVGDGYSTCDLVCKSPSVWIDTLGCITLIAPCVCTWEEAKAKCLGEGSRLTENIHNKDFNSLVHHFGETAKDIGMWVGGMREKWVSTRDNISLDTFSTGYPTRGEGEHCIDLGLGKDKIGLKDVKCSTTFYALCQSYYEGIVS